jgi:O-antigen ligase
MDFSAFAMVVILFRNYLLSKIDTKSIIYSIIILIILITTQSRFAWIGFLITSIYGLIICYVYSENARKILRRRTPIIVITLFIGTALFFTIGLDKILFSRMSNIDLSLFQNTDKELVSNSLESRVLIWITALNTFVHNPLTGVGYLRFSEISENYNVFPELIFNIFVKDLDAHTTYMNFLCETGIIGLTCFLIYVITIFRLSLKSIKASKKLEELKVSIVLNLCVFFVMVHSIYSGAFTMGQNAFFMHFIFGLAVANYVILKTNKMKNI